MNGIEGVADTGALLVRTSKKRVTTARFVEGTIRSPTSLLEDRIARARSVSCDNDLTTLIQRTSASTRA